MNGKTLHLILKSKWYEMIESGVKREEYRDVKPYWTKRLDDTNYDTVCFHKGYTSETLTFQITDISIRTGNPEWGAQPDVQYYVISFQ
jgi:uncharacterized protein